jgi:hypothetical protein
MDYCNSNANPEGIEFEHGKNGQTPVSGPDKSGLPLFPGCPANPSW